MKRFLTLIVFFFLTVSLTGCMSLLVSPNITVTSVYSKEKYTFDVGVKRSDFGFAEIGNIGFESKYNFEKISSRISNSKDYNVEVINRNGWDEFSINSEQFHLYKLPNRNWYIFSSNLILAEYYYYFVMLPLHLIEPPLEILELEPELNSSGYGWFRWDYPMKFQTTFSEIVEFYSNQKYYSVSDSEDGYIVTCIEDVFNDEMSTMASFEITEVDGSIIYTSLSEDVDFDNLLL